MEQEKKHWVERIFEECGAILDGHFILASGKHSGRYLEKAMVYTDPERVSYLCDLMVAQIRVSSRVAKIDCVIGPALGGISLSQWFTHHYNGYHFSKDALSLFTEKDEAGKQVLKRGYQNLLAGKRVLVVDDILTTGGSVKEVIEAVEGAGGRVVAVSVICSRESVSSKDLGYQLFCLWKINIESWQPDQCPLCQKGVPLTNLK